MKLIKACLFRLCVMLYLCNIYGQEQPPIKVFSAKDYGAETQNWCVSQSKDRNIYVANNKGLLEYNGARWTLYNSPNETIIRSVSVIDDLIYTGSNSEFGYWEKNQFGTLHYTSLSTKLNIEFEDEENFWNIVSLEDYILFQSLKKIYIFNKTDKSYNTIDSNTIIYKIFKVDESIYFQKINEGVYKIENGEAKLISNHEVILNNRLVNIFKRNGSLLIETENNGFYVLEKNILNRWDIPANKQLLEISVFRSIKLKDDSFILGTRSNGIVHLTSTGEIDYTIDVIHGLSNNTVHGVFEDEENNIWLALENGINCINIESPFSIYTDENGRIGTVYTSAVFNDYLYLGTNQGLFYKPVGSDDEFRIVEGIQEVVWNLVEINNTLFCGHDTGTSVVNGVNSQKINDIQHCTWDIKPLPENPNLLIQGNCNGLYVLVKLGGRWVLRNKIQGFDLSSRYFEIYNNHIFVSHEYKGVFRIKLDNDFTRAVGIDKFPGIEKELNSSLVKYKDNLLFAYKDGVHKYNEVNNTFVKDSLLSRLFKNEEYTSGKLIYSHKTNTLWAFSKNNLNYLSPGKLSDVPKVNNISLSQSLPRGLTGYENIAYLKEQKYLVGTSAGYTIVDLDKLPNKDYKITFNSITKQKVGTTPHAINMLENGNFKNNESNIQFNYSVAEFDKYIDTEYQFKLEGNYPEWSEWSTSASTSFKNLSYGDYTFKVRARVGNKITNNTLEYAFSIERPWYLSNKMIGLYIGIVLLFSWFMHNVYKRYYRKQREKLLEQSQQKLELKELENKQQLMRFNNEKLRQDIENKNRELGISTMSLIKKNEFLNTIKKELLNADNTGKSIKQVIKVIDRNLNNTDDWHVFEEAFNNADKDFLKKIKSLHPELTSNDLRLCAYLRLNLSSKEIAPLLNISPRSVEVKRYRLRKKMNLKHESSLTDYILEI
ncbi:helix-turn-helix and ligand-binding sensor domain-containing protein [Cognatitamlana onchidii]|uniref:helix-turn-helix and ligand-binding sensor domain-containing protein n=1 Tax=Cognatitamlana onchidii TaxID=2562860 RepID=UPI001F4615CB|nr:LuxR C-terminal-related transcriptional regulator [Algibacter onchidii]